MKFLFCLFISIFTSLAWAGLDCKSVDGRSTLSIGGSWPLGSVADLNSAYVRDYYKSTAQIDVGILTTIKDPQNGRYVSEKKQNADGQIVLIFLQKTKATDTVWSLEFNRSRNVAMLVDANGKTFIFKLVCVQAPDED